MNRIPSPLLCAALALIIFLLLPCSAAYASSKQQLKEELKEENQRSEAEEEKAEGIIEKIQKTNLEIADAANAIEEAQKGIQELDEKIVEKEEDIAELEDDKQELHDDIKRSIALVYELRKEYEDPLAAYMKSGSLAAYLNHQTYIENFLGTFHRHLDEYEASIQEEEGNRQTLQKLRLEEKEKKQEYEKQESLLEEKILSLGKDLKQANKNAATAKKNAQKLQKEIKRLEEEERRQAEEEARREAEAARQAALARSNGQTSSTGSQRRANGGSSSDTSSQYSSNVITNGEEYFTVGAITPSESDFALLSSIIQAEAGNQTYAGKVAVGSVVMNRVASPLFPDTIPSVLYAPGQFYPAGKGRLAMILAQGAREDCKQVARDVFAGRRNVTKFYFQTVAFCQERGIHGIQIGNHVFH